MANPKRRLSEIVREAIEEDPVAQKALVRGIVNVRALARQIQTSTRTDATLDALISAIHRIPLEDATSETQSIGTLIGKISLRDQVSALGVVNSRETWKALTRFSEEIDLTKGDVFRVITGLESTTVVIDSKNTEALRSRLPKGSIGRSFDGLTEIIVHLHEPSWEVTGILAELSTQLSITGVNIIYHFGYGPPPCIVFEVSDKEAIKAYQALEKLRRAR